jgi:hypothetical protein
MTEVHDDEPDPRLLWRWLGRASRPWAGWVFIGLGALVMLLGYLGVSREAVVAKQIPYLVSGGIGGVLLVVVGAYFLGTEELRKDSGRLDRLEQMVEELHAALLDRSDAPPRTNGAADNGGNGTARRVVAVPDGETFHRESCMLVAGKAGAESMTPTAAKRRKLDPCPLCDPVGAVT